VVQNLNLCCASASIHAIYQSASRNRYANVTGFDIVRPLAGRAAAARN
jgi:hypothetical protein